MRPRTGARSPDFFLTILHPDDRERVLTETAHTIATGEPLETEYRLLRKDGERRLGAATRASSCATPPARPLCIQGYILDITERKQREAALLASDAIVASSFDAIVSRTTEGMVTGWNGAAERLFGYSAGEMIGRSVDMLLPDQSGVLEYVDARLRRGQIVEPIEVACLRKDGTRVEVESTVSPIVDASGDVVGSSSITRDITERKHAQALAAGQTELLGYVAGGAALPEVLDQLARFVEQHGEDVLASILLLDRDGAHLRHGAAPSLPEAYCAAVDGIAIGASAGSCGTAAFRREPRLRVGRDHRPAVGGLARARGRGRAPRLLVDAHLRDRRLAARHVRALLPHSARARRARPRARRGGDARRRHRDRARALGGGCGRERGALSRSLRERQRADRDRHDGRVHHGGQPGLRARARVLARGAHRHESGRST